VGEGDSTQLLIRSLPGVGSTRVPDAELLRQYTRTAESALAREEVPPELREYVKQYFMAIGILGSENQGR
jgi:hypothetical protein